jgi:hypothetical protein
MADEPLLAPAIFTANGVPILDAALNPVDFTDHGAIAGEPATDRKIALEDGTEFRERIVNIAATAENITTSAGNPAPNMLAYVISNALLDEDGAVTTDAAGRPLISSKHEIIFSNETLGNLGSAEAVQEAVDEARRIAAGKAQLEFRGALLAQQVLAGRSPVAPAGDAG